MTDEKGSHAGGFRSDIESTRERGGPRYGEAVAAMRELMDRFRGANPDEQLVEDFLAAVEPLNKRLADAEITEWVAPSGTRIDLPARGNITLPPFEIITADADGVECNITFTRYHLGGNNAAHGGQIALLFDDLAGMASALHHKKIVRTAYLKVDFRSVTPLDTQLVIKVWVDSVDGRKNWLRGTLHEGDRLCAELDGLFIALNPGQI